LKEQNTGNSNSLIRPQDTLAVRRLDNVSAVIKVNQLPRIQHKPVNAYSVAKPEPDVERMFFPLPIDQRLITLVQYNVLRGIATNISLLSLHHIIKDDCSKGKWSMYLFPAPAKLPESLQPTLMQRLVPHEEWIDLIPCPKMRDNAIKLAGTLDHADLCKDVVGGCYEAFGDSDVENNGMIVWNDPWHSSGWELTDGFAKKWAALIEGCDDLINSTNSWRAIRNEDPLITEL
jgi:Domain of unknown function (DUF3425)